MLSMPILPLPLSGSRRLNFTVREITGGYDRRRFVRFAARLYRDDRYWAPDIISERMHALDPKKNHALAHIQLGLFMAESRTLDQVIGAVGVWVDDRDGASPPARRAGRFGMFEVINDEEVAARLLETAETWVLEHLRGAKGLRGPFALDPCRSPGLLVDGYNRKPGVLMPYNPPYYAELIESAGCEPGTELLAYRLDLSAPGDPSGRAMTRLQAEAQAAAAGRDLLVQGIRGEPDWQTILSTAPGLADTTWSLGPESPAAPLPELLFYLRRIAAWHPPATALVARTKKSGDVVAFGVAVPNIREPALASLGKRALGDSLVGALNAFSVAHVTLIGRSSAGHRMASRAAQKAGIRLTPAIVRTDFRDRGVEGLLLSELLILAAQQGYAQAEISPVPAGNTAARGMLAALGASPCKGYAIYEKRF